MTAAKSVTVCYGAVNAMLLNEFLEERRKHLEQQATISRLEKRIEAVAAGLQEVSVHVRLNRSANVPNGYSVSRHRRGFGGRQSLTNRPRYSRLGCGDRIRLRFWRIVFTSSADFPKTAGRQTDLNSRTFTPRGFFPSSGAAANWINTAGKEGKNHMHLIRKATPLFIVASGLAWLTVSPPTEAVVPPLPFAAAVKSSLHNIPEQFSALFSVS